MMKITEKPAKLNYPVQNVLDSAGCEKIKIFQRGKPHLEIAVFRTVNALESIEIFEI